jgi:hypothetical protein
MKIFALAVLLTVVQASPPVPRKAADTPADTSQDVRQKSASEDQSARQSAAPAETKSAPDHKESTSGQSEQNAENSVTVTKLPPVTIDTRRDFFDYGTWGFNLLLVLVGALQVVLLCLTLRLIRHQAREATRQRVWMSRQWQAMQGQLAQMISSGKQTDDLIKEAISQTANMDAQLEQMQSQTRLSVRPFVGLDEGHDAINATPLVIDESGNASLTYVIRAKNYSDVPASNVWAAANLVVADDLNTVYEWQGYACDDAMIGKPDIGQILFPGRDRVFTSMLATAKIIKKHEGSRLQVWLTGGIGYRDQFGYLYRTKFMFMLHDVAGHVAIFDPPTQPTQILGRFVSMGGAIDAGQIAKYNYGQGPYAKKTN